MTARIRDFLKKRRESGQDGEPVLVVDLDVVRTNYQNFAKALPDTRVFYAVKANPAPEVLAMLAKLGSCFDTASVPEIEMVLAAGATADRISYGNTIKKERDVARAYALGVRLYAVDCKPRSRRSPARRPARRCSAASSPTVLGRNGLCRASSAASPPWPRTCWSTPISSGSLPTASRSTSAPSRTTFMPGTGHWLRPLPSSASAESGG